MDNRAVSSPWSACTGKVAMATSDLAWKAAKRVRGRVAYRCAYCGAWHVGSDKAKQRKAGRASQQKGSETWQTW